MPQLVDVNANKFTAISCCFWTAYIIGDIWISCLKWKELKKKLGELSELLMRNKRYDDKDAAVSVVFWIELLSNFIYPNKKSLYNFY